MTRLTQIKGVGEVTEAKLVSVGYTSVEELSEASASNISEQTNISTKQAKKIIGAAGSYIREFSPTGKEVEENPENIKQFGETCGENHETFRSKFKAYRKLAKANFNQKRYKKFSKIEKQYLKQLKKLTSN